MYRGAEVVMKRWCSGGREEVQMHRCRGAKGVQRCKGAKVQRCRGAEEQRNRAGTDVVQMFRSDVPS